MLFVAMEMVTHSTRCHVIAVCLIQHSKCLRFCWTTSCLLYRRVVSLGMSNDLTRMLGHGYLSRDFQTFVAHRAADQWVNEKSS